MARSARQRVHREWFRRVDRGGRKSCSNCRAKLLPGESIWSWGEYVNAKWRNVQDLCMNCWPEVRQRLLAHKAECGCAFELIGYHSTKPSWMIMEETTDVAAIQCGAEGVHQEPAVV